jgi:hypothetical protein
MKKWDNREFRDIAEFGRQYSSVWRFDVPFTLKAAGFILFVIVVLIGEVRIPLFGADNKAGFFSQRSGLP